MKKSIQVCLTAAIGIFLIIFSNKIYSQDIHFSQFNYAPLLLNPALAGGFNGDMRADVNYKSQWQSMATTPYKTVAASVDIRAMQKKWKKGYLGVGISFFNERAGVSKMGTNQVNLAIASSRDINASHSITVGLQGGFAQRSMTVNDLKWGSQYNWNEGKYNSGTPNNETSPIATNYNYGDFSGGIMWNYGKYSNPGMLQKVRAGLAMFHINNPNQSFYGGAKDQLPAKYVGHVRMIFSFQKNSFITFIPGAMMALQGTSKEVLEGIEIRYNLSENAKYTGNVKESAVSVGTYLRNNDSWIILSHVEYANYSIGVSYDFNVLSDLKTATSGLGSMEIHLMYINPNPFRVKQSARF